MVRTRFITAAAARLPAEKPSRESEQRIQRIQSRIAFSRQLRSWRTDNRRIQSRRIQSRIASSRRWRVAAGNSPGPARRSTPRDRQSSRGRSRRPRARQSSPLCRAKLTGCLTRDNRETRAGVHSPTPFFPLSSLVHTALLPGAYHGRHMLMATAEKISVSLSAEDLTWARKRAKREVTSVSAVVAEALRKQRQAEARTRLLADLGTDDITEADLDRVRAEWLAPAGADAQKPRAAKRAKKI